MNWKLVNQFYQNKIEFYNQILDRLFFDIVTLETKIDKKNNKKLQQDKQDLDRLFSLIVLFLKSLALVNTYEHFKMKMIVLTKKKNMLLFNAIFSNQFEIVLIILIIKIKNEQNIDFTIN